MASSGNSGGGVGASEADEQRNRTFGAGLVDDPYPTYHEVRARCPVQSRSINSNFPAMEGMQVVAPEGSATYSTYGYEAGLEALRRADDFGSEAFYGYTLTAAIGPTVIAMDEPEHRRMRSLVQPAFARREMALWKERVIAPIVDEHFDRITPWGRADLYTEIGATVPVHTISAALGLPVEDRGRFFEWAIAMTSTVNPPMERFAASQAVADYVAPIIAARRRDPRDDLLSTLVHAQVPNDVGDGVDTRPLTDDELNSFVRLFIIAGAGTTYRGYGSLMYHLLTNPEQLDAVRTDRSLVPNAIDEALRIDQPLAFIGRVARRDTELDGVPVPAGSVLEVSVSAANHDPAQFPDPDRFDIFREKADRSITFGFGIHRCVGAHLAEAELAVMLERTLDRLPELRLDPDATDVRMTGVGFRMVTALPVVYRPSA